MSLIRKNQKRVQRRTLRNRSRLTSSPLARVSAFKSLTYFYGQVIDDNAGSTVVSCSSLELKNLKGDKKEQAKAVGLELAKRALEKGVSQAKFDRGAFLYHGRVKAFADGLREGGLKI